ncbi:MAG: tyrosine-type recombinase/integrase [Plesiomonas shigelloides]
MPVYRNKTTGRFVFEFSRVVDGQRVRTRKTLPGAWTRAQAEAYDREQTARIYARATGAGDCDATIEDAVMLYIKHHCPTLKSGKNTAAELAEAFWAYQGRPLTALADVAKAIQLRSVRADGTPMAPATIKNRIAYLRAACRYAWRHHGLGSSDPGARVTVPKVRNERQTYIDRAQMLATAKACKHRPTRAMIRIAFYSGMRISEIERAVISGDVFVLSDTKNGSPRHVPIHPKIRCCIGKYPPQTRYITSHHWRKARAAVGLGHVVFHDLRHTTASMLINSGVDLYTVGAVLGHKSAASTKRYAHLATKTLSDALARIGRRA